MEKINELEIKIASFVGGLLVVPIFSVGLFLMLVLLSLFGVDADQHYSMGAK